METWKDIPDYEGIYEVSDKGRVRTAENKTTHSVRSGERKWKQRILKQKSDPGGHKRVSLWKNKRVKDYLVHRLVAMAFIESEEGKTIINHKDGVPWNNDVSNLEWCTYKENNAHAVENRLNCHADPIVLLNLVSKESHYFDSKAEASKFIGRNHGYISRLLKNGENNVDNYEIYVQASKGGATDESKREI